MIQSIQIMSCFMAWYGLFQDLSTWTLDELKALKVSTDRKRRSRRPWVTPLQPAWAPWLPDQEKLILPPQNSWHLQCWLGRGCYITYRYKSLSSKIRFIEVDVPFWDDTGKQIYVPWKKNSGSLEKIFTAPGKEI